MDIKKAKGGGSIGLSYPTLVKNNYTTWALKMKVYMQVQGVWTAVEQCGRKDGQSGVGYVVSRPARGHVTFNCLESNSEGSLGSFENNVSRGRPGEEREATNVKIRV